MSSLKINLKFVWRCNSNNKDFFAYFRSQFPMWYLVTIARTPLPVWRHIFTFPKMLYTLQNGKLLFKKSKKSVTGHFVWPNPSLACYLVTLSQTPTHQSVTYYLINLTWNNKKLLYKKIHFQVEFWMWAALPDCTAIQASPSTAQRSTPSRVWVRPSVTSWGSSTWTSSPSSPEISAKQLIFWIIIIGLGFELLN